MEVLLLALFFVFILIFFVAGKDDFGRKEIKLNSNPIQEDKKDLKDIAKEDVIKEKIKNDSKDNTKEDVIKEEIKNDSKDTTREDVKKEEVKKELNDIAKEDVKKEVE